MAVSGITISNRTKLTPITEKELMEYSYYVLYQTSYLYQTALNGRSPDMYADWDDSTEQNTYVLNSHLWQEIKQVWEYAEHGMHADKFCLTDDSNGDFTELKDGYITDLLVDMYKWFTACEGVLYHDGDFGHETPEVREAGSRLVYKFLARLKLDFKCNIDQFIVADTLFPMAQETTLSSHEYALLAGLSHVGAVRNEVNNKNNPLIVTKEGNKIMVTVEVARERLQKKRKFIQTQGVDYGKAI